MPVQLPALHVPGVQNAMTDIPSHLFGSKKSNKFLIIQLNHNFIGTEGRYFTMLTLAKDSYFSNVNTVYAGKLRNNA